VARIELSHYRLLMKIDDTSRRVFYAQEYAEAMWRVRQLERQIKSFYYELLLATKKMAITAQGRKFRSCFKSVYSQIPTHL
jgi:predicted nuclease of restriction endonuclease-like (RecB) superfamily